MTRHPWLAAALAGIGATVAGTGAAELLAALVGSSGDPIVAVGGAAIDLAPPWLKDAMIAAFGTADKTALIVILAVVLLVAGAGAGMLQRLRSPIGLILLAVGGMAGAIAAVTRADAGGLSPIPAVVGTIIAIVLLRALLRRAPDAPDDQAVSRRTFLGWAGGSIALGALATLGGELLQVGARTAAAIRNSLVLPTPAVAAPPIPAGADLRIPGLAPFVTPNGDFYRIDTALAVPLIDPTNWTLHIGGMVDREVTLTWPQLLALPLEESVTTIACVSNDVGGSLIGNARWLGYPLRHLLAQAGPSSDADMVFSTSADGFTASTPLGVLQDEQRNAILAIGMNGEPLPPEHGFPARMVVPGLYGYVSATKWVVDLKVTRFDQETAYWTERGWAQQGPIKLESRIDVPRSGATVTAGTVVVAGVAWHQHVGISAVEVRVDGGAWQPATIAEVPGPDTWRQWRFEWAATAGQHTLAVRATDATGEVQTADFAPPAPDGASGWHQIGVTVS